MDVLVAYLFEGRNGKTEGSSQLSQDPRVGESQGTDEAGRKHRLPSEEGIRQSEPRRASRQAYHFTLSATATASLLEKSGYLYCFANYAWDFYNDNRGLGTVTVK